METLVPPWKTGHLRRAEGMIYESQSQSPSRVKKQSLPQREEHRTRCLKDEDGPHWQVVAWRAGERRS